MCKTTTGNQAAARTKIIEVPINSEAGAIIPLQNYLAKAVITSAAKLVPPTGTTLPPNVRSTHVPISLMPLTNSGQNNYYAGVFDDEMHFSASLVKVAALFAAGQFHEEATTFAQGFTTWASFLPAFNASLKAGINSTADSRILSANAFLTPQTATILKQSAFPTIKFSDSFAKSLTSMIVASSDPAAAVCIKAIGYGYINTALKRKNFFNSGTSRGIWLAGTYAGGTFVRIPCVNDHDDAQVITTREMCRLFSMIRLNQLPETDPDANSFMQSLLDEPKATINGETPTAPWIGSNRGNTVARLYTIVQDKIGFAGLGSDEFPNVYSEGLIIKWNNTSQVNNFNAKIDPGNANTGSQLSGEIAVCWQNLLVDQMVPSNFDGIIEIINDSISGFLSQTTP